MFVKWQKRRSTGDWPYDDQDTYWQQHAGDLLMASVVESKRVDGKPRHQLITYLGSIRENFAQGDSGILIYQDDFWRCVSKNLKKSSNRITKEDRAKIEAALAKRVELPAQVEIDQLLANARKELAGLRNIKGEPMCPNPTEKKVRDQAVHLEQRG